MRSSAAVVIFNTPRKNKEAIVVAHDRFWWETADARVCRVVLRCDLAIEEMTPGRTKPAAAYAGSPAPSGNNPRKCEARPSPPGARASFRTRIRSTQFRSRIDSHHVIHPLEVVAALDARLLVPTRDRGHRINLRFNRSLPSADLRRGRPVAPVTAVEKICVWNCMCV